MDLKIDPKHYTLIGLIIVFLVFGTIIGYVVNKQISVDEVIVTPTATPEKEDVIVTPTETPDAVETVVAPTPTETEPAETPLQELGFTYKSYDPAVDQETRTIEFINGAARPYSVSIHPGDSVLFKVSDTTSTGQSIFTLIIKSEEITIGRSGAMTLVTFNNKEIYTFKAVIYSDDPNINPFEYGKEGTIAVY